jgi:putative colanic acid biosynthesis UDP-glucose lipid carrier transferase
MSEFAWLVKGTLDRLGALIGLILASPLLLFCAAGIAMSSPGPVLFRQRRVGYKGREFNIIKFRTMDHEFCGSYTPTRRSDNRIFKFGGLLRKTSLDELPQLINVLKGDMSLVGPRPHMVGQQVEGVPPGKTGNYRLGAGQRLARSDRNNGTNRTAGRA